MCRRRVDFFMDTLQPSEYVMPFGCWGRPGFLTHLNALFYNRISRLEAYPEIFDDDQVYLLYNEISEWIFNARCLETCDVIFKVCSATHAITEWIDAIIEGFENTTAMVRSLAILWLLEDVSDDDNLPRIRRLQAPQSVAAKPSRNEFVAKFSEGWYGGGIAESPASLFKFRNSADGRVLNVYKSIVTGGTHGHKSIALLFETVSSA